MAVPSHQDQEPQRRRDSPRDNRRETQPKRESPSFFHGQHFPAVLGVNSSDSEPNALPDQWARVMTLTLMVSVKIWLKFASIAILPASIHCPAVPAVVVEANHAPGCLEQVGNDEAGTRIRPVPGATW